MEVGNIHEIRAACSLLKTTAEEILEILSTEERNKFAIGFIQYVENTYEKRNGEYYYKDILINHVHRNINEVLENYISLINAQ